MFPLKQTCMDVNISTKNVAPHFSRGRFAEGVFPAEARGRDPLDLQVVVAKHVYEQTVRTNSSFHQQLACGIRYPSLRKARGSTYTNLYACERYPSQRGSFAEGFAEGFDTSTQV